MQKSETMSLRLRPEEKQQLEELARRADRSAGWVLRELVRAASESRRVEVTAAGVVLKLKRRGMSPAFSCSQKEIS